jgi:hypothetical protein
LPRCPISFTLFLKFVITGKNLRFIITICVIRLRVEVSVTTDDTKMSDKNAFIRLLNVYFRLYSFVVVCKRIVVCHFMLKRTARNAETSSLVA